MRRPLPNILLIPLLFLLASFTLVARDARIEYAVSIPDPASETFHVTADIYGITPDTMIFHFPVWAPGAYDIVNFGAFVRDFTAQQEKGGTLKVLRGDTNTFRIIAPTDHIRLHYVVHDIEKLDNSAWFSLSDIEDSTKVAFAVGTALFGYADGYKGVPCTVTYTPPEGWDLAVALDPIPGKKNMFSAADYDELVDAPVQMGSFQRLDFEVKGIPHTITLTAPIRFQKSTTDKLISTTKEVVTLLTDFFGEMPYKRYLFQIYLKRPLSGHESFGALEHANSSTYLMPFFVEDATVNSLQPVISHEYWHLWSPKRFHVTTLGPFDYQHGPHTTSLWFHEGITEYYARALLVRNHLRSVSDFLQTFGSFAEELYGNSQGEPITTLSADLTERPLSEIISLYTKGPLIGLLLDGEIRVQTKNKKSLDDALRFFNKNYGDHLGKERFGDNDIIPIMEKATGAKLSDFYRRYIAGTEALPLDDLLPKIGLRPILIPYFGARIAITDKSWRVVTVYKNSMAEAVGLQKRDEILGFAVGSDAMKTMAQLGLSLPTLSDWIAEQTNKGKMISMTYLRGEERYTVPLTPKWAFQGIEADPSASSEAEKIRKSMLGF